MIWIVILLNLLFTRLRETQYIVLRITIAFPPGNMEVQELLHRMGMIRGNEPLLVKMKLYIMKLLLRN